LTLLKDTKSKKINNGRIQKIKGREEKTICYFKLTDKIKTAAMILSLY
jgi:hypothetical protein